MNYLGIEKEKLEPVVTGLNELLSNYQIYYQNLRSFHWYVEGQNFFELHTIFEELYNDAKLKIDEIAERVLTLRFYPIGNLSEYLCIATIPESKNIIKDEEMTGAILENHKMLIQKLREVIKLADEVHDEGTIDLLAGILSGLEKRSWMLEAWRSKRFANMASLS